MGFYGEQVLPRLQNKVMDRKPMREVRARVCAGLRGDVVEIGFGTGLNVPFYPGEVEQVWAVEPSRICMRIAEPRIGDSAVAVEYAGLTGERLDLPDDRFDAALSTWTLCTIPDVDAAVREVHRVLRPGGVFHFIEHGHAPDPGVARWQQRIEPLNRRVAGGCHLTRPIDAIIERAGFAIDAIDRYYMDAEPKPWGSSFEGRARKV